MAFPYSTATKSALEDRLETLMSDPSKADEAPTTLHRRILEPAGLFDRAISHNHRIINGPIHECLRNFIRTPEFPSNRFDPSTLLGAAMKPAMILVTRVLRESHMQDWLVKLLTNNVQWDPVSARTFLGDPYANLSLSQRKSLVDYHLHLLTPRLRITFAAFNPANVNFEAQAYTCWSQYQLDRACLQDWRQNLPDNLRPNPIYIVLSDTIRQYYLSGIRTPEQVLLMDFIVFKLLLHEIAHALALLLRQNLYNNPEPPIHDTTSEPKHHFYEITNELGWSHEASVFGPGKVHFRLDPIAGVYGLCFNPEVIAPNAAGPRITSSIFFAVDNRDLYRIFDSREWVRFQQSSPVQKRSFWQLRLTSRAFRLESGAWTLLKDMPNRPQASHSIQRWERRDRQELQRIFPNIQ